MREQVVWFAEQMESRLKENDHKNGWQDCSFLWLYHRMFRNCQEVYLELDKAKTTDWDEVIRDCADVANYALMIADLAKQKKIAEESYSR